MLDLRMPGTSGFEVLELLRPWLEASPPVPVIVLTGDTTRETRRRALAAGARDFITKPFDSEEVCLRVTNHLAMRQIELELKSHGDELERRVVERTSELEQARLEVIDRLAMAAEYRDDDTHQHAQRIGNTAALLAAALDVPDVELIRRAAPLHDIGKIAIPDAILLKPGRLTETEFEAVKNHTVIGGKILSGGKSQLLRSAEEIALTHHERWDGRGYPAGLAAEQIPASGRLVAVADVFDALTHERPYKQAWSVERAVEEISQRAGHDFDPAVVEVFQSLEHGQLTVARPLSPDPSVAGTGSNERSGADVGLSYRLAPSWPADLTGASDLLGVFEEAGRAQRGQGDLAGAGSLAGHGQDPPA
jgi:putative two-component system response regulator